jgi:hypothetical protein
VAQAQGILVAALGGADGTLWVRAAVTKSGLCSGHPFQPRPCSLDHACARNDAQSIAMRRAESRSEMDAIVL